MSVAMKQSQVHGDNIGGKKGVVVVVVTLVEHAGNRSKPPY